MEQDLKLTQDVRDEMERYVATVAEALRRSGTSEKEVLSVLQDVRNHMMERLAARAPQAPTVRDVREVIAGMAPPESYAETPQPPAPPAAVPGAMGRSPLPEGQRRLLMIFGFVLILAGLCLAFRRVSFPVVFMAGVFGLIFVKWAVRGGTRRDRAEKAEIGVPAPASPAKEEYPLSESHKRLLMVFGFVLVLVGLLLAFPRLEIARWEERLPVAIFSIIAGLLFVKWAVRQAPRSFLRALWSFLVVAVLVIAALVALYASLSALPTRTAIQGSGHVITETRAVGGFSRVSASGFAVMNITQGEPQSLKVEADDNILPWIETEVSQGTLSIGQKDRCVLRPSRPVTINLAVMTLDGIKVSGATNTKVSRLKADKLDITVSGSGKIAADAVTANALTVQISGSGDCNLAGRTDTEAIHISGSGNYCAGKLEARSVTLSISGSASALVAAKETLDVKISGSGRVEYYGQPRVSQAVSGSGRVISLGQSP